MAQWVNNPSAMQQTQTVMDFILGSGRSLGGRHGNSLWYSCLENLMDKEAWRAIVHRVSKSQTRLK